MASKNNNSKGKSGKPNMKLTHSECDHIYIERYCRVDEHINTNTGRKINAFKKILKL